MVNVLEQFIRLSLEEGKMSRALALSLGLAGAGTYGSKMLQHDQERSPQIVKAPPEPEPEGEESGWLDDVETSTDTPVRSSTRTYSRQELHGLMMRASKKHRVSPAFVDAIIRTESNYNPDAISSAGAQGIMQIMPDTAADLNLADPYDPAQAIDAGTRHLADLLRRYDGDYTLAAAAYNAGVGNVDKYEGVPPFDETQRYVVAIQRRMEQSIYNED